MINYTFRGIEPQDLNFIYNSWLKSYRKSDFAKKIPNDIYYEHHKKIIDGCLNNATVLIACNPDNPTQVFGYIIASNGRIHYTYVKYSYRKLGLARALFQALVPDTSSTTVCSHANYYWRELSGKYNLVFNPYGD